ncbi:MAG: hypothetical protein J6H31_02260 [Butyrivibrio sp.]|nr:hypothetical protein [Butyrivibrio sp.]
MKKNCIWLVALFWAIGVMCPCLSVNVEAAEENSFVMMKFVNNTRFKKLAPENKLSDLVMEKLVASGKIHLKETRPIDEHIDMELFDENYRANQAVAEAEKGNLDALFEIRKATSMANSHRGQIISPQITMRIGKEHGAEYLIQGTILGISRGTTEDPGTSVLTNIAGIVAGKWGGSSGARVGAVLRDTKQTYTGVNIQSDLRVIRADTGEVIWEKNIISVSKQEKLKVADIASVGSDKLSMNLYELSLDQAAQKIVDELIADLDKGLLSGRK